MSCAAQSKNCGIINDGFSTLWSFIARPSYEFETSPAEVAAGDTGCLRAWLVGEREEGEHLVFFAECDCGLSAALQLVELVRHPARALGHEARPAGPQLVAVDAGLGATAG